MKKLIVMGLLCLPFFATAQQANTLRDTTAERIGMELLKLYGYALPSSLVAPVSRPQLVIENGVIQVSYHLCGDQKGAPVSLEFSLQLTHVEALIFSGTYTLGMQTAPVVIDFGAVPEIMGKYRVRKTAALTFYIKP